jgi:hypothetical protein
MDLACLHATCHLSLILSENPSEFPYFWLWFGFLQTIDELQSLCRLFLVSKHFYPSKTGKTPSLLNKYVQLG